ncbi:MAG TPA: SDR family oxidoreductase [Miltoncostaeaceae bacterium]|nr:SDR family oxidoreductase [Miltoncostaeaceae bacterium]
MAETAPAPRGPAVVTGASSGIGRAFAENLARRGHPLLITARRGPRLEALARWARDQHGVPVRVVVADLATDAGLATVRAAIDDLDAPPEVAVLNAGFGTRGAIATLDRERESDMVRLNCLAVADLAAHIVPMMVRARRGALVVVSSAAAFQPIPHMATYAATKAFELHYTEALADELRACGVRAVAVCPGPVATEFTTGAGSRIALPIPIEDPQMVVRATWRALGAGRPVVPAGPVARLAWAAARIVPRRARVRIAGRIHRITAPVDAPDRPPGEAGNGGGGRETSDRWPSEPPASTSVT